MHISLYPLFKHVINIYFGHSGAVEINCTHKAEILSLHTVHMANVLAKRCLTINTRQIWSIYLEFCFWPAGISKSNIYSLLALSFVFTNSCGKFVAIELINLPLCPACHKLCLSAVVGQVVSLLSFLAENY